MSALTPQRIEELLRERLEGTTLCVVQDFSDGCGTKFEVEVESRAFEGLNLLARHRAVNAALADSMHLIHALSIKRAAPPTPPAAE